MTTPDDLICTHEGECPDSGDFPDIDRLWWEAVGYFALGGGILVGLTVLGWIARGWMLAWAVKGWR